MKRAMVRKRTPSGRVVACTACSWWVPMIGVHVSGAKKVFDAHVCADHPSLENTEKTSGPE